MARTFRGIAAAALALSGSAAAQAPVAVPQPCPGPSATGTPTARLGAARPQRLIDANFPDPFLARFAGRFHAYATGNQVGGAQRNVQHVTSRDLVRWSDAAEAFPAANLPVWVDKAHPQVWAPEVLRVGPRYVLYYNARHTTLTRTETPDGRPAEVRQRHCLGAAVADRPEGPFVGIDSPLVCSEFPNGVIDASVFEEAGQLTLTFKDDSNCCAPGSAIYVQGLSPDGLAAVGPAIRLVANSDSPGEQDDWEWRVVEAPTMVKRHGSYWLFYSGNFFGNRNYAVAALRCASPRGPCIDQGDNPILWSHNETRLIGPGHQSVLQLGQRDLLFFHAWNADPDGRERPGVHQRCLYVAELRWPVIEGEIRPRVQNGKPSSGPGSDRR